MGLLLQWEKNIKKGKVDRKGNWDNIKYYYSYERV